MFTCKFTIQSHLQEEGLNFRRQWIRKTFWLSRRRVLSVM